VAALKAETVGGGALVLALGLTLRLLASFLAVGCGDLSLRERIFVALAWLPKATVQAAIGPLALDRVRKRGLSLDARETQLAEDVLTIAVLVILVTAPIGAAAIMLSAPKLLHQGHSPTGERSQRAIEEGEEKSQDASQH